MRLEEILPLAKKTKEWFAASPEVFENAAGLNNKIYRWGSVRNGIEAFRDEKNYLALFDLDEMISDTWCFASQSKEEPKRRWVYLTANNVLDSQVFININFSERMTASEALEKYGIWVKAIPEEGEI